MTPADGFNDYGSNAWSAPTYPAAGLGSNAWSEPLFPEKAAEPAPEPPPPAPSSTMAGVGKKIERAPYEALSSVYQGIGAEAASAGTGLQSLAGAQKTADQRQLAAIQAIDAGKTPEPGDDRIGYSHLSDEDKADARQGYAQALADDGNPADSTLAKVGGAVKGFGQRAMDYSGLINKAAEADVPMTPEEQARTSVQATGIVTGMAPYLVAALGGPAAVLGLMGTQGAGSTYEEAKKAGASDETAAKAAVFGGTSSAVLGLIPFHKAMEVAAALPNALKGQFFRTVGELAQSSGTMVAFSEMQKAADNLIAQQTYAPDRDIGQGVGDPKALLAEAAGGALLPAVGLAANAAGRLAARAIPDRATPPGPAPVAPDQTVLGAPDIDSAISAATAAAQRPAEGARPVPDGARPVPGDARPVPGDAQPEAAAAEATPPRPPASFPTVAPRVITPEEGGDGLAMTNLSPEDFARFHAGEAPRPPPAAAQNWDGTLEQAPGGGLQVRATDTNGGETIHPIQEWNPDAPPVEGVTTIAPATATAIRDHYAAAGVNTVFYKDDPTAPFDGMALSNPDTLLLSNNPTRNVAQVAGHEFTHVLADTTLPDGTSLADLLQQQIAAGITPAGQKYAAKTFGATAPARVDFGSGAAGDAQHAAAVQAHLLNELGADIGGEAPKFQTFLPRVVDAVQQRFGTTVASDVLGKLIDGLRAAMGTIRSLFGETGTRSQNWVTNIGEIHDTLAKMYAAKFGTPVEREQAGLATMRDKAERDRFVAPQAPPEQSAPVGNPVRPAAAATGSDGAGEPIGFTTAKGSTYVVHDDGTTTRNKSPHVEHDATDVGIKERSAKTIYVDGNVASGLSAAGVSGMVNPRVVLKDGKATLVWRTKEGAPFGTSSSSRDVPFSLTPEVGKAPLELWTPRSDVPGRPEAYSGMHAGNAIVGLTHGIRPQEATAPPELSAAPEAPAAPQQPPTAATPDYGAVRDGLHAQTLQLRRWLAEMDAERTAAAANSPKAKLLEQTEAAILRPVGGDEAALPDEGKARLDQVRTQLDEAKHPVADTPEMATVRTELEATPAGQEAAATKAGIRGPVGDFGDYSRFTPGQKLISDSGRVLAPVPEFSDPTASNRAFSAARKKIDRWLLNEAMAEAKAKGDTNLARSLARETVDNFPPASRDTAMTVVFGADRGPEVRHGAEAPAAPLQPGEHPGLVLTSLQTGKTTHIQPPGTVPPGTMVTPEALHARIMARLQADPRLQAVLSNAEESPDAARETVRKAYRAALGNMMATADNAELHAMAGAADQVRDRPIGMDDVREITAAAQSDQVGNPVKPEAPPARPADYGASNKVFTASAADAARARLREKFSRLNAGFDPEMAFDGLMLSGFHIEAGARKFVDYARAMIEDLGAAARPHLAQWYTSVRMQHGFDATGMDSQEQVDTELKRMAEAPSLVTEAPDEARPPVSDLAEPASGGDAAAGGRAGLPARDGYAGGVEAGAAGDVPPAGQPGAEAGLRPEREAVPGDAAVRPGGVSADGRGGTGDAGVVPAGTGGPREPVAATVRPNFHIDDPDRLIAGTPKVRFARNREAVEALRAIEEEQRDPTPEELQAMAGYIGWGSFGQDLFQGTFERQLPRPGWDAEGKWLRDHLGKEEWESAQRSIINAHYTDPPTVKAMWDMVARMGFKGGRVLEPSMGIGNFFGMMPRDMMAHSALTGIELDRLTAQMAKLLYPKAGVHQKGYQDSRTPDNFYDLVIGNWPFAAQSPADRRYDRLSPTLHDYFFLKALDQTRPGGLVVGVTSAGTMDKAGRSARIELAKKGELLGAFRLPTGAFEKYAGTAVVTDILVFRKRTEPAADVLAEPWINASDMKTSKGDTIRVNDYFQAHPEAVLGEFDFGRSTVGRQAMTVNRQPDFAEKLAGLADRLPADAFNPPVRGSEPRFISNNTEDRQLSVTIGTDGKLYQVQGERLALLEDVSKLMRQGSDKARKVLVQQVENLVGMRRAYGALIDAERDGRPETEDIRTSLAQQYNAFVKEHGPLSDARGMKLLNNAKDPAYPALAALERPDGTPSLILSQPTTRSRRSLSNPSVNDAYVLARNESATLDMDRVAELAQKPRADVERELLAGGAVMRTPGEGFEASDIYLSGNVRQKLREAQDALASGEDMQASVDALTKALPATVPYYQIEAKLGAPWIGDSLYKRFLGDVMGLPEDRLGDVRVRFAGSRWRVTFADRNLNFTPEALQAGHPDYRFDKLVQAAMGNNVIRIMKKDSDGKEYLDTQATEEANAKVQGLRERFQDWAWQDAERKVALEGAYNEALNAVARPRYNGAFMDLSGMALRRGNDPFSLREHQMNAIWRGVVTGRGLFAHEVGTGKSYTMAGIAVEGRRYGVMRKPLVFAHNANSASVAREFGDMYPGGKFLYIDNLAPDVIQTQLHRIANEDWDAVIMPHSLIDRMALSRETLMELAQDQITDLENEAIEAAREDGIHLNALMMDDPEAMKGVRSVTAKQLVKQREAIIANIEKQANRASAEGAVPFEKLGVDSIIVDEAHEFKKPPIATRMQLKGLNTATSARSIALDFLTGYVNKQNNGRGTFLFTGTPVTNALNEIYNMARYFMRDRMEQSGVKDWDAWFNTFADGVSDVELTAGGLYEPVKRLSAFVNVDELVRSMSEFTDVVQAKDMPEFVARPTPDGKTMTSPDLTREGRDFLVNGRTEKPQGRPYKKIVTDVAEMSPDQKEILADLQARWKAFKEAKGKEKREMLMEGEGLKVGNGLRAASLDARMFDADVPDDPTSKVNRVAANVLKHYKEERAGQAVFVDQGYNAAKTSEGRAERFVLVRDLVNKLVAGGIPKDEIKIVAGNVSAEAKKEVADAMNRGDVRVVIGQSSTLGVGVNMQVLLRAMHHMDAPWRPGDLEQRNGRGERQGNTWNTVLEYRYVTEGIDGRGWQILTTKDRFIKQFISAFNDTSGKRLGNIEGDAADIAENEDILQTLGQAAGDPRIMLRAKYQADVNRLERRERMHTLGQADAAARAREMRRMFASQEVSNARDAERLQTFDEATARAEAVAKATGDTHRLYEVQGDGAAGAAVLEAAAAKHREDVQKAETLIREAQNGGEKDTPEQAATRQRRIASLTQKLAGFTAAAEQATSAAAEARKTGRWYGAAGDIQPLLDDQISTLKPGELRVVGNINGHDLHARNGQFGATYSYAGNAIAGGTLPRIGAAIASMRNRVASAAEPGHFEQSVQRLEASADEDFPRRPELNRKRQQLAQLEDDLQENPVPPPAWLRHGAPLDSEIYVDGQPRTVRGHRMNTDYKLVTDEGEVSYRRARDANGNQIYDVHPPPPGAEAVDLGEPANAPPGRYTSLDAEGNMVEQGQAGRLGSDPQFSPRITGADRETEAYTPAQKEAYANVGRITEAPTMRERWNKWTQNLGQRIVQQVFDPYVGVKASDPAGYLALRNANSTARATEMFMHDGTLRFEGSTYAMDDRNGGVQHSLIDPLHGEENRFIWWVAAHRAESLAEQDRENLWSPEDIATLKATNQGAVPFDYTLPNGQITRSREAIYLDSVRKLDTFNRNTLDLAVQSGLIASDAANAFLKNPFYVPFYRMAEGDGRFSGASITAGFVKQYAFKQLKGGAEKLNHDLWANAVGNWTHMIDASLRNRAAAAVLDVGVTNGAVSEVTPLQVEFMGKAEKASLTWVMNNGLRQSFMVTDPMLYTAISALEFTGLRGPVMDTLAKFKSIYTQGVTADPRFMLRTTIKDAENAIALSPLSLNVFRNTVQGFRMSDLPGALQNVARAAAGRETQRLTISDEAANAMAGGATMHLGSGSDTGARKARLDTMLDSPSAISRFGHYLATVARAAKEAGAQGEDVQRLAIYHKLIAAGVPHDQAAFAGRDLEDFTLRGAAPIVRALTQTVPFMNAWLQGLYKIGRAASDADRNVTVAVGSRLAYQATRKIATVMAATTMATLALDAIYGDDEDYKKRTEADRNSNFWFKFGSTQVRIPMGFEIAAMSRIAANGVEAFFGTSQMTGRRFVNTVATALGSNLYISPVATGVAVPLHLYANKDDSGRAIVPQGMEKLQSQEQYTPSTTLLARGISSAGSAAARAIGGPQTQFLAPVQLDYIAEGYLGWLGSMILGSADMAARAADQAQASVRGVKPMVPVRPSRDLWNVATAGMISTETTPQSRYLDMLYQQNTAVSLAYDTYHSMLAQGRAADARAFLDDNRALIGKHGMLAPTTAFERDMSMQVRRVENSTTLTADQKHDQLARLNAQRNRAAENLYNAQNR